MTKDDIIPSRTEVRSMAQEAGFVVDEKALQHQPNCIFHTHHMVDELLERFAAIIASRVAAKASAASASVEREACAKVCDEYSAVGKIEEFDRGWLACAKAISNVIRARGETSSRSDT